MATLPFDIGIGTLGEGTAILMSRDEELPASLTRLCSATEARQKVAVARVFAGGRALQQDNILLCTLRLPLGAPVPLGLQLAKLELVIGGDGKGMATLIDLVDSRSISSTFDLQSEDLRKAVEAKWLGVSEVEEAARRDLVDVRATALAAAAWIEMTIPTLENLDIQVQKLLLSQLESAKHRLGLATKPAEAESAAGDVFDIQEIVFAGLPPC